MIDSRRFDPGVFIGLTGIDEAQVGPLLDSYLRNQRNVRADLETAFGCGESPGTGQQPQAGLDRVRIENLAHRLKSGARSIGADAVANCCEQLEAAARSGSAELEALLPAALAEIDELGRAIREYLDSEPSSA